MLKNLRFLILTSLWFACQSGDSSKFGVEPDFVAYNDDAPLQKKSYCNSSSCDVINAEDIYSYDPNGKLLRIDSKYRTGSGTLELQSYQEFSYNDSGELKSKIRFEKNGVVPGWVSYEETQYEYENDLLKIEKNYFNQHQPDQRVLTSKIIYEYNNGKLAGKTWFDAQERLIYRVANEYKKDVLSKETYYDAQNKANRTFEHTFAGNRRQIGEYLVGSRELLAMIEKTYDNKGRLSAQETKVNNPLLCALPPGRVQYSY
jgi:uncharacterized protein YkuJ